MVEKFLFDDLEAAKLVRTTFAGLWGLDMSSPSKTKDIISRIRGDPEKFVLKPQLEGGGNNIYGSEITKFLNKINPEELEAYIAMERIFPAVGKNYLVRPGMTVELVDTVSELGVYGYLLGDISKQTVIKNVSGGHFLKTKETGVDEGGIMAGASSLDSPFLI